MKQEYKVICRLLSVSLFPELNVQKTKDFNDIDWEQVFEEMKHQTIAAIPIENVMKVSSVPSDIKSQWMDYSFYQVGTWTRIMAGQNELVQLLLENQIPAAILKGSSAAVAYPKPEYRTMGDVDFIVREKDFEKSYRLMIANGYTFAKGDFLGELELKKKAHHIELVKNGVVFELHREMSRIQDKETEDAFCALLQEGLDHIEWNRIEQYLFLLKHIVQHLGADEGIGLRQIIDWEMFVHQNLNDYFWEEKFRPLAERAGLENAAMIFTRMCQLYLGLPENEITWCMKADEQLCRVWMDAIIGMGNFGRKAKKEDEGALVLYRNRNIFTLAGSLQRLGLQNWKALEKHRWLSPFAWFYQICRYLRKVVFRKSPVKSIKRDMEKSKARKHMVERLQIKGLQDAAHQGK